MRQLESFEAAFGLMFPLKHAACKTPKQKVAADVKIGNVFRFVRLFWGA